MSSYGVDGGCAGAGSVRVSGGCRGRGCGAAEGEMGAPGHAAGCACCVARGGAGVALGRLFERRAREEVAFFRRVLVVADEAGRVAVVEALLGDPLASGRFRLEGQ